MLRLMYMYLMVRFISKNVMVSLMCSLIVSIIKLLLLKTLNHINYNKQLSIEIHIYDNFNVNREAVCEVIAAMTKTNSKYKTKCMLSKRMMEFIFCWKNHLMSVLASIHRLLSSPFIFITTVGS